MKKFTYLLIVLLAFAVTGCEKDEDMPEAPKKTLEELYPDWKNLTWIATFINETNESVPYPRVEYIKIEGDTVEISKHDGSNGISNIGTFYGIDVDSNKEIIYFRNNNYTWGYTFKKNGNKMILDTILNDTKYPYRYEMRIN